MRLRSFSLVGFFVFTLFSSSLFSSTLVNGIAVLVNDEPITLYEVHKLSQQTNVSLRESLNLLVQRRLETSQIKKLGINASNYEVTKEIEQVAQNNGISTYELRQVLASKGMKFSQYKKNVEEELKIKKLYQQIYKSQNAHVSELEIRNYYKANPEHFKVTDKFSVTTYRAASKIALQEVRRSPMKVAQGATLAQEVLRSGQIEKRVAYFLEQTSVGEFTPIVTSGNGYVMYLLHEKVGAKKVSLEQSKVAIVNELQKQRQKLAVKNYFEKLKADASIVVLRRP